MKAYSKYKKSGIPSLGLIPETWQVTKMKYVADLFTGNSLNDSQKEQYSQICDDSYPYVATKDVTFGNEPANYDNGVWIPKGEPRFKLAPKDSFLLCVEGGSAGRKMTYLDRDVCFVNKLCCFISQLNPRYHYYYIQSQAFGSIFKQSLQGLIGGVSISDLEKFPIVVPTLAEQETIAAYLDEKTAKIDECIKLLELQKTDLQKFRMAIISEVVTRGLNNVKLKDSNIQWLGSIPETWRIVPLKTLISFLTDGTHQTPTYVDYGVPFISIKDMSGGKIDFSDTKYITEEEHQVLSKHAPVEKGDILFSRIGTLGVFIKVDTDKVFDIFVSLGLMKVIPDAINTDYLVYYLSSSAIRQYIDIVKAGEGTSAAKFNLTDVRKTPILLPSVDEQEAIVAHLNSKTNKIDEAIHRIDEQINDLRAYRTALISEVVTGKIDVRNN